MKVNRPISYERFGSVVTINYVEKVVGEKPSEKIVGNNCYETNQINVQSRKGMSFAAVMQILCHEMGHDYEMVGISLTEDQIDQIGHLMAQRMMTMKWEEIEIDEE